MTMIPVPEVPTRPALGKPSTAFSGGYLGAESVAFLRPGGSMPISPGALNIGGPSRLGQYFSLRSPEEHAKLIDDLRARGITKYSEELMSQGFARRGDNFFVKRDGDYETEVRINRLTGKVDAANRFIGKAPQQSKTTTIIWEVEKPSEVIQPTQVSKPVVAQSFQRPSLSDLYKQNLVSDFQKFVKNNPVSPTKSISSSIGIPSTTISSPVFTQATQSRTSSASAPNVIKTMTTTKPTTTTNTTQSQLSALKVTSAALPITSTPIKVATNVATSTSSVANKVTTTKIVSKVSNVVSKVTNLFKR